MNTRDAIPVLPIVFAKVEIRAGETRILGPISLTIVSGAPTVLIGPNGSGKTTLLRAAMGLMPATKGTMSWGGRPKPPVSGRAIVFQRPVMLRRSCAGNLGYALGAAGISGVERDRRITELLHLVGLEPLADRPARRLSGGEQQRLAIARALASRPAILFLDEPTASLDPAATKAIEDLIRMVSARGVKVVMATHDLGEARRLAGEVVLLNQGELIEAGQSLQFFNNPRTDAARRFIAGELLV